MNPIFEWVVIAGVSYAIYRRHQNQVLVNKPLCSKRTYALIETAVAIIFFVLAAISGNYISSAYRYGFNATAFEYGAFYMWLQLDLATINAVFTGFYSRSLKWSMFKSTIMALLTLFIFGAPIPFLMIMFSKPKQALNN